MTTCPECGTTHDAAACAREAADCDCCRAIFTSQEDRAALLEARA